MKDKLIPILMVFGLGMFFGVIVVGFGLGGIFVPLNGLGASIACGGRELQIEKNDYAYVPGQETTLVTAYSVDKQAETKEEVTAELYHVTERLRIINGVIFGLIFFGLGMLFLKRAARKLNIPFEDLFKPSARKV